MDCLPHGYPWLSHIHHFRGIKEPGDAGGVGQAAGDEHVAIKTGGVFREPAFPGGKEPPAEEAPLAAVGMGGADEADLLREQGTVFRMMGEQEHIARRKPVFCTIHSSNWDT